MADPEGAPAAAESTSPRDVGERFRGIQARVARALERSGRPGPVSVVGVTKGIDPDRIRAALDAGLNHLGENRLQEAIPKMKALADRAPTWHFIGHLQSNKARRVAELFDRIESLTSLKLAGILANAAEETGRDLRVFVQVKIGDEPNKHGVPVEQVPAFFQALSDFPGLQATGLMCIPPNTDDAEATREHFRRLKELHDALRHDVPSLRHLSIGMSSDFEVAVEEGATEVRIGRALFGPRSPASALTDAIERAG